MAGGVFNVGIIGYGLSAKTFHIPFVAVVPDFKLSAIVQRSPKPENDVRKDYKDVTRYSSADQLFHDNQIDVVIVTTAPNSHFDLTKAALKSGKHGIEDICIPYMLH